VSNSATHPLDFAALRSKGAEGRCRLVDGLHCDGGRAVGGGGGGGWEIGIARAAGRSVCSDGIADSGCAMRCDDVMVPRVAM